MADMDDSELLQTSKMHSWIGLVSIDKAANSISIQATVPELTPALTGSLAPAVANQTTTLKDIEGNAFKSSVTTTKDITADYLGNSSNRKYPPDVVQGEQVRITKLANADKYYWESMGRDDGMRKTETVRYEAANRKNHGDPADDGHTYSLEMDTKVNQHIRLQTSKGNGEKFAYTILLDAKNGKVQLSDDAGNGVTIDSANAKIIMQNSKNAFLMLNGLDAFFGAPRDVIIKAGRQMVLDSPLLTISNRSGAGVMAILSNAISIAATTSCVIASSAIGLNGNVKAPNGIQVNTLQRVTDSTIGSVTAYPAPAINLSAGTGSTS